MLLVLHLSRLPPPGPLPFHGRVASALLEPAAAGGNGQLFALARGDIALLFRPADAGAAALAVGRALFGPGLLHSAWRLPEATPDAIAFLAGPLPGAGGARSVPGAPPSTKASEQANRRQVAVLLRPGAADPIRPLFREWAPEGDTRLAAECIGAVLAGLDAPGPALPIHLNLSVPGILGEAFARLLDALAARGGASVLADRGSGSVLPDRVGAPVLAAEVALRDVVAEPNGFVLARERLRLAGARFVLDGVTPDLLPLVRPDVLDPHLVKLGWSPALPAGGGTVRADLHRLGPDRLVLTGCDDEAAVLWGRGVGIARFQGSFIDRALAAARLSRCPAPCGLTQCRTRAAAVRTAERSGCAAPWMLEAGVPSPP